MKQNKFLGHEHAYCMTVGEVGAKEVCGGYGSGQYVQKRCVEGMVVGSMCRRGVWGYGNGQ